MRVLGVNTWLTNEGEIVGGSIPLQLRSTLPIMTGKGQYALCVSRAILSSVSEKEYVMV